MKALSVKQPWASLIVSGAKDIENRTRCLPLAFEIPQRIYVHASLKDDQGAMQDRDLLTLMVISPDSFPRGAIIGAVTIVGCIHANSASKWFEGPHGFMLEDAVKYETPIPCKGALGFWTPPDDVLARNKPKERCTFCGSTDQDYCDRLHGDPVEKIEGER